MKLKLIITAALMLCLTTWSRAQNKPQLLSVYAGECGETFPNNYHYDIHYSQVTDDQYQIELVAVLNCSAVLNPGIEYRNDSLIIQLGAGLQQGQMRDPAGQWRLYTEYSMCECSFCISFVVEGVYESCRVGVGRYPGDGVIGYAKDLRPENCGPHIPSPYSVYGERPLEDLK